MRSLLGRLQVPILAKLSLLTVLVLLATTVPIIFRSSEIITDYTVVRERDSNLDFVKGEAAEFERIFLKAAEQMRRISAMVIRPGMDPDLLQEYLDENFNKDPDIVSLEIWRAGTPEPTLQHRIVNEAYLSGYSLNKDYIPYLRRTQRFPMAETFSGQIEVRNSTLPKGAPLITLGVPLSRDQNGSINAVAIADFRLDLIQKKMRQISSRTVFLVDREGTILAHPNEDAAMEQKGLSENPVIAKARSAKGRLGELRYQDPETKRNLVAAFAKTQLGTIAVSEVEESRLLEPSAKILNETIYIAGRVLAIALFIVVIVSIRLTDPIDKLVELTTRVARGDFGAKAELRTRDEIGQLADSFNHMVAGLREREKAKSVLAKFHGSDLAQSLLENELKLQGVRNEVTVFFSDIRSFTKFSENREPEEVVAMLNEYFAVMVEIINRHHGTVDKFVGDAIMAVWGAVKRTDQDAYHAVRACLEMRQALEELNQKREARGEPPLIIGMGLHTGHAIAGTIGSDQKMEFTVIGDTVNTAARIEASTKAFGTDLLISEVTAKATDDRLLTEVAGEVVAKGKSQAIKLLKVRGYREGAHEIEIRTPWSDYAAEDDVKVKVAG